jgi:hypothetical protein
MPPVRQIACTLSLLLPLVAGCEQGININKLFPDARLQPACGPGPTAGQPWPCSLEVPPTDICRSPAGDWSVVVPAAAKYRQVLVKAPEEQVAAAAVDWDDGNGNLAGFVISLPAGTATVQQVASHLAKDIEAGFLGTSLSDPGRLSFSHDGYEMVAGMVMDLTPASSTELSKVRNRLYPALLSLDITQLEGLPDSPSEQSNKFKLVLSVILRPEGRAIVTGGVATLDSYTNLLGRSRVRAEDMANATLLSTHAASVSARCELFQFSAPGMLDMVWVVSGADSPTMNNARLNLHQGAVTLASRAASYSLDVRGAVVDMGQTKQVTLCSPGAGTPCGTGRLWSLGATELPCLQACLLQPGPTAAAKLYGLSSAKNALLALLPRSTGDPKKLRRGAQVAVFFVSDVEDGSVAELFPGKVPDPLSDVDVARVEALLQPLLQLLVESSDSELAGSAALAMVAEPSRDAGCAGRRGTGYIELVKQLGHAHELLCLEPAELDPYLEGVVDALAPRASLLALVHRSASVSLRASLNGEAIFRSLRRGFDYDADANALLLRGLSGSLKTSGNTLETTYIGW